MTRFDFNKWRAEYDSYSFEKQKELNNELEKVAPNQIQHKAEIVGEFLRKIPNAKVLEIGGWKGELAQKILSKNKNILLWHNYDICSNAIEKNVCKDTRFKGIVLTDFAWNLDIWKDYNIVILSHIIEHIRKRELIKLFDKFKHIKYIYIDAPLNDPYRGVEWKNYCGTHILECGWDQITEMLKNYKETILTNVSVQEWQTYPIKPSNIRVYELK